MMIRKIREDIMQLSNPLSEKTQGNYLAQPPSPASPLWKIWLWTAARIGAVWVGFSGFFAAMAICPC